MKLVDLPGKKLAGVVDEVHRPHFVGTDGLLAILA